MDSWEQLQKEARSIENSLQVKLQSYSELSMTLNSMESKDDLEAGLGDPYQQSLEIEKLLTAVTSRMSDSVQLLPTPSKQAALERYRELLKDCKKQYNKLKENINKRMNTLNLMSGHKMAGDGDDSTDYLLQERSTARNVNSMMDLTMQQAEDTKSALMDQRKTLLKTDSRMSNILGRFPVINSLVNEVKQKRARDNICVAIVIGLLVCFVIWYIFH